jgi:hypothetical protein
MQSIVVAIERLSAILPKMIVATQGDETDRREPRQYLEDHAVGISKGVIWKRNWISPMTIIVPIILHSIYPCMLNRLMDRVTSFLKQQSRISKFHKLWVMMPPYPGLV